MKTERLENRWGGLLPALVRILIGIAIGLWVATPVLATDVSGDQAGTWTLANSPYIVTGRINVQAGDTLTIQPGVVVQFNDNQGIWVYGTLNADGTPAGKITFTSNGDLVPDWWRCIQFLDGSAGILDHCIIRYGGYSENTNIQCTGNASPTISNTTISHSDGDGLRLYGTAHPTLSNCTVSDSPDWPIQRWDQAVPMLSGNTLSGNGHDAIYVNGHTIPDGAVVAWDNPGVPYVIGNTTIAAGATLNIAPGTIVKLLDNTYLMVNGTLNAEGTASDQIIFTAYTDDIGGDTNADGSDTTPAGDYWRCIYFDDNGGGALDHCIIRYGGAYEDANVYCQDSASPTISNCVIAYSDLYGIRLDNDAQPTISNCTISNNGSWAIRKWHWNANPHLSGNTFSDNGRNAIYVNGQTIPADQIVSWDDPGVPYVIENTTIAAGATLNIAPGTIVKLLDNTHIWVYGTLNAKGTVSDPIVFTAYTDDIGGDSNADGSETTPAGDYWRCIYFDDNGGGALDHCIIRYGGYAEDANIHCQDSASPTISNSTISHSDVDGIRLNNDAQPTISNCTISHNGRDGIRTYNAARPSITNCTIADNTGWPIRILGWNAIPDVNGCTIEDNGRNGIYVDSHDIPTDQNVTWSVADVPYVIGNVRVLAGATLTIPEGMIVKFAWQQYITVLGGGTLKAVGTAESPIVFTAYTDDEFGGDTNADGGNTVPGAGYWNSLYFDAGAAGTVDHCRIRYGGYQNYANIVCNGASPTISWTEIAYSSNDGLKLQSGAHPVLENNIITRNAGWPVYIEQFTAVPDFRNNTITQNGRNGIRLKGGDVPADQKVTLDLPTVPYVADNIIVRQGATLNIPAGVIVKFTQNSYLQVDGGGILRAKGTVDNRIVFTAYTDDAYAGDTNSDGPASIPVGDYWNSLYFYGGSRDTLDYCIVKYGGAGYDIDANVVFDGDASLSTVTHSIITYSDGAGIRCKNNARPAVINCVLSPNAAHGIKVDGTSNVAATNNWWGDSTGPYHSAGNPNGLGIAVTDHVLFGPWLDTAPVFEPDPAVVGPTGPLTYTISLTSGLNMISVPLKPTTSYTAQTLLETVDGTLIIAMADGNFITYLPAFPGTGFAIAGGKGYIVNVPSGGQVTFTGTGWSGASKQLVSPESGSVWAFAVGGRLEGAPFDAGTVMVAKNLRTGDVVSDRVGSVCEGYFAAAWVNLDRREVARSGDRIEVMLKDPTGNIVAGPVVREVTSENIRNAVVTLNFEQSQTVPEGFALGQNVPNPFNPTTSLPYQLDREAHVVIRIYDVSGQLVRTLDMGQKEAGVYKAHWDGKNQAGQCVATGVYCYSMKAGSFSAARKMLMFK
ncbi:MAG: right-handed parallel beta-helix repeat-containing protein [Candidatus Latescibacterota bacterium]